jgi:hypothetical protein
VVHIWSHFTLLEYKTHKQGFSLHCLKCHICLRDNPLSSDHSFLQVWFCCSVSFHGGYSDTLFQYCIHFNAANNAILSWPVERWRRAFRMHEFDRAVTIIITLFPSQHQSITFHHMCRQQNCIEWCYSMQYGRSWVLPEDICHRIYFNQEL